LNYFCLLPSAHIPVFWWNYKSEETELASNAKQVAYVQGALIDKRTNKKETEENSRKKGRSAN
jgi:hypothetical protein